MLGGAYTRTSFWRARSGRLIGPRWNASATLVSLSPALSPAVSCCLPPSPGSDSILLKDSSEPGCSSDATRPPHQTAPAPPTSPQSGIKSPLAGPSFVLALAGIPRPVVHITAIEKTI